jgi:hypothetical protein
MKLPPWTVSGSGLFGLGRLFTKIAALPPRALVVAAVTIFVVLSIWEMVDDSPTYDEGVHLAAGYLHLTHGDFSINPEHPPLAKMWCALPLLFQEVRLPVGHHGRDGEQHVGFAYRWLYQVGNDPEKLLFWGRLPTLFWGAILLVSIYAVCRDHFGPQGALISLVLSTFSPALLAHSHYVTTDLSMTSLFFLATVAFWRFLHVPSLTGAMACGLLVGGALAAKYSAVLLGLILVPLMVVFYLRRGSELTPGPSSGPRMAREAAHVAAGLAILVVVAYGTLWASYRFRYSMSPEPPQAPNGGGAAASPPSEGGMVGWMKRHHALPEGYLDGMAIMHGNWSFRTSYALGRYSEHGFYWYFPFSFLVKTPVPAILLTIWGVAASVRRHAPGKSPDDFLMFPMVGYWIMVVLSPMNVGIRHLLPAFPAMMVLAGGVATPGKEMPESGPRTTGIALLLAAGIGGCLIAAPYFISYFNLPSIALWNRHFMLCDSSLDWGQDLKRLKKFMENRGIPEILLSYYGSASPAQLGLRHATLPGRNIYTRLEPWVQASEPRPGDYVAISARNYRGIWLYDRSRYLRAFDELVPIAEIGHSILVFRIPPNSPRADRVR